MTSAEDVGEADEPRSFRQATFPRRVLVASAGSIMHVLMALVLAWASLLAIGQVAGHFNQVDELTSWAKGTHTPAQLAGLRANDVVVSVNGHANLSEDALFALIKESPGIPLTFVVRREGPQHTLILHTLTVTPVDCHTVHECSTNSVKVPAGQPSSGVIGVAVGQLATYSSVSLPASVPDAFSLLDSTIKAIAVGTYHVFSPAGFTNIVHADVNSQVATSTNFTNNYRPISIWGIVHAALQLASKSPKDLFLFFMIVNLAFGTLNMLPMLPLDGGYVAIAIYERLRTRRGRVPYRADVNKLMPLVYAFVLILLVYVVSDLYLDIAHPLNF
jgi:membrane-associated protease RseP (regulator of RpoE activity)